MSIFDGKIEAKCYVAEDHDAAFQELKDCVTKETQWVTEGQPYDMTTITVENHNLAGNYSFGQDTYLDEVLYGILHF